VFVGFFAVHLLLLLGTFDAVDLEESEYGNVAVALLDGHPDDYASLSTDSSHGDNLSGGAGRRRRTVWSAEVLVTPVFVALGPSMLSLKVFTLLGGALWALCWFGVARKAAPRAPPWLVAMMFILPLPLVQRQALSATNLFAHLGSSLALGAAFLLLLGGLSGRRGMGATLLAGVVAGLGVYQSTSLLPMLIGPLYFVWKARGIGGTLGFVAAMAPGALLLAGFRDPGQEGDLASFFTGLTGGDPMRGEPVDALIENARVALLYGAGFGRVDPQTLKLAFLPWGIGYTVLAGLTLAVGWPWKGKPEAAIKHLRIALLLSTAAYLGAWAKTGFQLETSYFDGLRYLLPIAGILPVLLLVSLQRKKLLPLGGLLLAAHIVGFALLFRPDAFPAPWQRIVGYEPTVMKQWMQGPLDVERIDPTRQARWARFAGTSAARQAGSVGTWAEVAPLSLVGVDSDEFWRGVGIGLLMRLQAEGPLAVPQGAPEQQASWIAQGMAMGTAYQGCQQTLRERLSSESGASEADLWYGFGRVDIYCNEHFGTELEPAQRGAWERGLNDGWIRDYGRDEDVDVAFLERLYIY
jgi:hypothetical protein